VISHLRCVARVLRRGALYCIDIDKHETVEASQRRRLWRRRKVRHGAVRISVREFLRPISWHAAAWIYELECTIRFPDRSVVTRDLVPVRYMVPKLLDFAARAAGVFTMIACYPDLSFDAPLDQCDRWLGILRRL
jgi:hypothetical protein